MPKKLKTVKDHLLSIEIMLAGIILKREVDVEHVAKIIGIRKDTLIKIIPEKKKKTK